MNKSKQYKRNEWIMIFVLLMMVDGGVVQTASAAIYPISTSGTNQAGNITVSIPQTPINASEFTSFTTNFTSVSSKTDPYQVNTTNLTLWWKFDENIGKYVNDTSGSNINGTWKGTNQYNWTTGKYNSGGNFTSATSQYVEVVSNSLLNNISTVVMWVKTSNNGDLFNKFTANNGYIGYISAGKPVWQIGSGTVTATSNAGGTITDGNWHHLAFVRDATTFYIYTDGVKNTPKTYTGITGNGQAFQVGASFIIGYANGVIDDVKIYNTTWNNSQVVNDYMLKASQLQAKTNVNSLSSIWNSNTDNPVSIPYISSDVVNNISINIPQNITQNGISITNFSDNAFYNYTININGVNQSNVNTDFGWLTLINYDFTQLSSIPNQIFLSTMTNTPLSNHSLVLNISNGLFWNYTTPIDTNGSLYFGGLYPSGHVRYRINVSVSPGSVAKYGQTIIRFGNLTKLNYQFDGSTSYMYMDSFDKDGNVISTFFTETSPYIDMYIEYFPNGTSIITDLKNPSKVLSGKYNSSGGIYSYDYISPPMISFTLFSDAVSRNITIYNFEEAVPKSLITPMSNNKLMPFGFDARAAASGGIDYLLANGQSATYWFDPTFFYGGTYDVATRAKFIDYIQNKGIELGNHFSTNWPTSATMDSEVSSAISTFGVRPLSWEGLQNLDNSSEAQYAWNTYHMVWRNAPQAFAGGSNNMQSKGVDASGSNMIFWNASSSVGVFTPAFTHSVTDVSDQFSMSTVDFQRTMGNYTANGVSIIPYAKWYYIELNSVTNITNVGFSSNGNARFNVNTTGYDAYLDIYNWSTGTKIWYSTNGIVTTNISASGYGKNSLIVNTRQLSTVLTSSSTATPSSGNLLVSVNTWNTASDFRKVFTASSNTHINPTVYTIGDFPANTPIQVNKNGVFDAYYLSDSSGFITFTHSTYSDLTIEAFLLPSPIEVATCPGVNSDINAAFGLIGVLLIVFAAGMLIQGIRSMNYPFMVVGIGAAITGAIMIIIGYFVTVTVSNGVGCLG